MCLTARTNSHTHPPICTLLNITPNHTTSSGIYVYESAEQGAKITLDRVKIQKCHAFPLFILFVFIFSFWLFYSEAVRQPHCDIATTAIIAANLCRSLSLPLSFTPHSHNHFQFQVYNFIPHLNVFCLLKSLFP